MLNKGIGGLGPPPPPISPAAQAAALYASTSGNGCLSSCAFQSPYAASVVSQGSAGPACEARKWNYGGLNPDFVPPNSVYIDPRSQLSRGVPLVAGQVASTRLGPCGYAPDLPGETLPRTQYAPSGPITTETMVLDNDSEDGADAAADSWLGATTAGAAVIACSCPGAVSPYSLTAILLMPKNALVVRDLLVATGLVRVGPRLAKVKRFPCCCSVFGSNASGAATCAGWIQYALQFVDTGIVFVPNPAETVASLNEQFVDNVFLAGVRSQVIARARVNYARAEGNRAYLVQEYPQLTNDGPGECDSSGLPAVLPGSCNVVVASDTLFATRQLAGPASTARLRASAAELTGVPYNCSRPALVPIESSVPVCPVAACPPPYSGQPVTPVLPFVI